MSGLMNFIDLIRDHWTEILMLVAVVGGCAYWVYGFVTANKGNLKEATIELAKKQVKNIMLRLVSDAEMEWGSDTGKIKRSQVIDAVFDRYPILRQVTNQDELLEWLDTIIDQALIEMREILKAQEAVDVIVEDKEDESK